MKLRELGEFGLIDRIAGQVVPPPGVRIGIGDDAAAVTPSPGFLTLVTSDMLVEGIHFDLSLCDPRTLGRKSLAVNLSDIAAMGGIPRHFLLSLALPEELPVEFLDGFIGGLLEMAGEFGVALVGGDTCASRGGLVISVTLMGEQLPERVISRGGAQPGDLIFLTGTPGDSALGLRLLRKGERTGPAVRKHLDPFPRVREGLALAEAGIPTAMIDVSDGLLADLGHILDLSGAGARVDLAKVPLSASFLEQRPLLTEDPFLLPLSGGEDYELLFTASPAKMAAALDLLDRLGTRITAIGEITAAGGVQVLAEDGSEYQVAVSGYNHFS
ncbi:MAG TPA: thiamine-phosphate kinase [Geobacteraceae bacterium]|nr:thiamine-phosphate kinase [Geobacteraceae bacterium]